MATQLQLCHAVVNTFLFHELFVAALLAAVPGLKTIDPPTCRVNETHIRPSPVGDLRALDQLPRRKDCHI